MLMLQIWSPQAACRMAQVVGASHGAVPRLSLRCRHGAAAVGFGDSPQDVWAQLGAPSGAALRGSSPLGGCPGGAPDFFYSYCDRWGLLRHAPSRECTPAAAQHVLVPSWGWAKHTS